MFNSISHLSATVHDGGVLDGAGPEVADEISNAPVVLRLRVHLARPDPRVEPANRDCFFVLIRLMIGKEPAV